MGDGLKLPKDKRHKSSSSIIGVIEGTRSERKLDLADSIAEGDDLFALADARCDNVQEKIDSVKAMKRKKKFRRLSLTRVNEMAQPVENTSVITARVRPKKKAVLARRLADPNSTRDIRDPVIKEQRHILDQMRHYSPMYEEHRQDFKNSSPMEPKFLKKRVLQSQPDRDRNLYERKNKINCADMPPPNNDPEELSDYENFDQHFGDCYELPKIKTEEARQRPTKSPSIRRRHVSGEVPRKLEKFPVHEHMSTERPVVELYNKRKTYPSATASTRHQSREPKPKKDVRDSPRPSTNIRVTCDKFADLTTGPIGDASPQVLKKKATREKLKFNCRRYELPTMASQMKQSGARFYHVANRPNIPFVATKSTAPSHNIGVNIQQVLNGLKVKQPLSGIPSTLAYHMGLGHVPSYLAKDNIPASMTVQLSINAIKLGRRLLRLPSRKFISYNRMLNMYREGDGMVSRFLHAISRPHYFYTSMYNLATTREDLDGATSKGNAAAAQEAKQSLAEYASLYREYEQLDKALREGNYDLEWERRRNEITKELALREDRVRKMVQEYKGDSATATLRASASNAEDGSRRRSNFNLVE